MASHTSGGYLTAGGHHVRVQIRAIHGCICRFVPPLLLHCYITADIRICATNSTKVLPLCRAILIAASRGGATSFADGSYVAFTPSHPARLTSFSGGWPPVAPALSQSLQHTMRHTVTSAESPHPAYTSRHQLATANAAVASQFNTDVEKVIQRSPLDQDTLRQHAATASLVAGSARNTVTYAASSTGSDSQNIGSTSSSLLPSLSLESSTAPSVHSQLSGPAHEQVL